MWASRLAGGSPDSPRPLFRISEVFLMQYRTGVRLPTVVLLLAATVVGACRDNPLDVQNKAQPDVLKAYGTPANVESIVSKLFQQMWNGQHGASDNIQTQSLSMSFESHSQLGNFGMGTRAAIPRSLIDNSIGNAVATGNFRDFDVLSRVNRSATNSIAALDRFKAANLTIG